MSLCRRLCNMVLLAGVALVAAGCSALPNFSGPGGTVRIEERGRGELQTDAAFDHAYYAFENDHTVTVVLIAGGDDAPEQALTVRYFWRPAAARTPITADATNASVHFIDWADLGGNPQVGVYDGAGFVYLKDKPGSSKLTGSIWQADIVLASRTDQFPAGLQKAVLTGSFTALHDQVKVQTILHTLQAQLHESLGYPRLVRADLPVN